MNAKQWYQRSTWGYRYFQRIESNNHKLGLFWFWFGIWICSLMLADPYSPLPLKRRRFTNIDLMDPESAQAKLAAAKEKYGREILVFETSPPSPPPNDVSSSAEASDDFYDFTPEDYYRVFATKKEDKFLKTRKLREAEEAARRSKVTKAVIRVRFPDNCTLEATFHSSETFQSLVDLLTKVIAQPEVPFYIYTTPPKKVIKDLSKDFYSAGFIPGGIVYFSHDLPKGDDAAAASSGPFLCEEVVSLKGLELAPEQQLEPAQSSAEPTPVAPAPVVQERKPADRKSVKPKWLKM